MKTGENGMHGESGILPPLLHDRRSFIRRIVAGGTGLVVGGWFGSFVHAQETGKAPRFGMILVDFDRCTGCRTCETACAQHNHQVALEGGMAKGLGNPFLSNIRVYSYNPDVDVPVVCPMCRDNPCIEACPVDPDDQGRRALYRDPGTQVIRNDAARCIACGSCAEACRTLRSAAIVPNRETRRPERMCTLCDGDPQCVEYCPYGALAFIRDGLDGKYFAKPADKIAAELMRRWYGGFAGNPGENR